MNCYENKVTLISSSLFLSKNYDNNLSETFAILLRDNSTLKSRLFFQFEKVDKIADVNKLKYIEEKLIKESNYVVLISSEDLVDGLQSFLLELSSFFKDKTVYRDRLMFLMLGDVKIDDNFVKNSSINLSLDKDKKISEESLLICFNKIKENIERRVRIKKTKMSQSIISVKNLLWCMSGCPFTSLSIIARIVNQVKNIFFQKNYPHMIITGVCNYIPLKYSRWRLFGLFSVGCFLLFIFIKRNRESTSEVKSSDEILFQHEPIGLRNTKETCYMNSMIQALASSNKLTEELTKNMENHPSNEIFQMFLDVIKGINEPSSEDRVDKNTKRLITFMNKVQWDRTSQQDAFQLLSHFINAIQKKQANGKDVFPPKFKILHTFSEDSKFNKVQDHLALALPLCDSFTVKPGVPLKNQLDKFFEWSIIEDGPYGTQMFLFEKAPEVLILHIQANEWDYNIGNYIKPKYYIKYEMYLDYTFKVQKKKDGSESEDVKVKYELMAVVHHMGNISGGHYITYRRHGEQWYLTNDEQVEKVPFNFNIVPYIMVYEKKDEDVENDMELC